MALIDEIALGIGRLALGFLFIYLLILPIGYGCKLYEAIRRKPKHPYHKDYDEPHF